MESGLSSDEHPNINEVADEHPNIIVASGEKPKCSNSGELEIRESIIHDHRNGKACHQCRQKIKDLYASCKNLKKGKLCSLKFCRNCLLHRYGENVEEVEQLSDWVCPKCRAICNCSICQKRRGEPPTGRLYHAAKESGFKSVSEMLAAYKVALEINKVNEVVVSPSNEAIVEKELQVHLSENAIGFINVSKEDEGSDNVGAKFQVGITNFPIGVTIKEQKNEEEIHLPVGTKLTEILDIELPPEDVGNALQLLEFCRVFGNALDVKEGEAEAILRELVCSQNLGEGQKTLLVQFQIKVLTMILNEKGNYSTSLTNKENNSWLLKPFEDLISESNHLLKDFPLDWLQEGIIGYSYLDLSKKLKLLNFLCDEALGTKKLRSHILDENSRHVNEMKKAKSNIVAAKEKEKGLRQKLQKEMANAVLSNVAPLPMEEHDAFLTKTKSEVTEAHAEVLKLKGRITKGKQSSDATRVEPELLDNNGQKFWKLKSYNGENVVLLQDIKILDETTFAPDEKWFVYDYEKKNEVDKYISSRVKKLKSQKVSHMILQ